MQTKQCIRCKEFKTMEKFRWFQNVRQWDERCRMCRQVVIMEVNNGSAYYIVKQLLIVSRYISKKNGYAPPKTTVEEVLNAWTGKCHSCEKEAPPMRGNRTKVLHIDHCHKTGKFRGWLCAGCNHALGHAKDSIEVLEKLIKYLKRQ